jgi:hypothetical protein
VVCKAHQDIPIPANTDGGAKYAYPDGTPKDPLNWPVQRPYFRNYKEMGLAKPFGNAYHVYEPDLKSLNGALSSKNVAARDGRLAPTGADAEVVYAVRTIYPFAESFVRGKAEGAVGVDFSLDEGKTWIEAGKGLGGAFRVDLGRGRWDPGLPSTYNMPDRDSQYLDYTDRKKFDAVRFTGFQYRVRLRLQGALTSLRIDNTLQCNIGMLPTLLPGANRITVEAEALPPGAALEVEYAWEEAGKPQKHVEKATSLPHVFEIRVKETDPLKVKCLYQTTSVVPK